MSRQQRPSPRIMHDLLEAVNEYHRGRHHEEVVVTKRQLMRSANLNYQQLNRYLDRLQRRDLLTAEEHDDGLRLGLTDRADAVLGNGSTDVVDETLLQRADREILKGLREGRNTAANIADQIEEDRQFVYSRLLWLASEGYVRNIGNGVFERVPHETQTASGD